MMGFANDEVRVIVFPNGEGFYHLTDEQLEQEMLAYIKAHIPGWPTTVEAIARRISRRQRSSGKIVLRGRRNAAQAERDRAASVLSLVLDALQSPAANHDAALEIVQNFVTQFADWPDEDIAARVVEGMGHAAQL